MRRFLTVTLLSLLCISLQAQDLSFKALKDGVIDVAEIKKELILNGFTKVTNTSESSVDTYAYGYDEEKETGNIWVNIDATMEIKNAGFYTIMVLTSGHYVHDDLVEEITEKCEFTGIGESDELEYTCEYTFFDISSQDGNNVIYAYPNIEQLPMDSPIMDDWKEAMNETLTEEEMEEFMEEFLKAIEEIEEE